MSHQKTSWNCASAKTVSHYQKCIFLPKGTSTQQEVDEASPDEDDDNEPGGTRGGAGGENAVAIKLVI